MIMTYEIRSETYNFVILNKFHLIIKNALKKKCLANISIIYFIQIFKLQKISDSYTSSNCRK